jgi:hypothetical protein
MSGWTWGWQQALAQVQAQVQAAPAPRQQQQQQQPGALPALAPPGAALPTLCWPSSPRQRWRRPWEASWGGTGTGRARAAPPPSPQPPAPPTACSLSWPASSAPASSCAARRAQSAQRWGLGVQAAALPVQLRRCQGEWPAGSEVKGGKAAARRVTCKTTGCVRGEGVGQGGATAACLRLPKPVQLLASGGRGAGPSTHGPW